MTKYVEKVETVLKEKGYAYTKEENLPKKELLKRQNEEGEKGKVVLVVGPPEASMESVLFCKRGTGSQTIPLKRLEVMPTLELVIETLNI